MTTSLYSLLGGYVAIAMFITKPIGQAQQDGEVMAFLENLKVDIVAA